MPFVFPEYTTCLRQISAPLRAKQRSGKFENKKRRAKSGGV
jgi:hypothetical protein